MTNSIRTCLWFRDGRGREAAEFYCSLIPGSRVERAMGGETFDVIDFSLGGVPYQILDAGPMFPQSECVSIAVQTDTQAESDRLWAALTADGGQESMCGWLKDRFGVSWQVVPTRLGELLGSPDPAASQRCMTAMLAMVKLDIAALERAAAGS